MPASLPAAGVVACVHRKSNDTCTTTYLRIAVPFPELTGWTHEPRDSAMTLGPTCMGVRTIESMAPGTWGNRTTYTQCIIIHLTYGLHHQMDVIV